MRLQFATYSSQVPPTTALSYIVRPAAACQRLLFEIIEQDRSLRGPQERVKL
jgi:hypothetical protein